MIFEREQGAPWHEVLTQMLEEQNSILGEEDISGQFRVTVPDAGELDQLRTWGGVYRRVLYTVGNRDNAPPERTQSLPASSHESVNTYHSPYYVLGFKC